MWNRALTSYKLKASGIHLSLSVVAFGAVLYFILARWYPPPWFIEGGWQGVRIMIFVDLVLGPFLTFIIFNPAKSRRALAVDFSFIGMTQLVAFTWGVYAVHAQRPVAIVYFDHAFSSVEERALRKQSASIAELMVFGNRLPVLAYTAQAHGPDIRKTMVLIAKGVASYEQLFLYRPLQEHLDDIFADSGAIEAAIKSSPEDDQRLRAVLSALGITATQLRFAQFSGRYADATLVFSASGDIVGALPYVKVGGQAPPARQKID